MKEVIEKLVADELQRANEKFPPFASRHEGAAVIREEIEEAEEEIKDLAECHRLFWLYVKAKGEPGEAHYATKMRERAVRLAEEAIQVAAMCDKYMPLLNRYCAKCGDCMTDGKAKCKNYEEANPNA